MSRGYGARQRRVLAALRNKATKEYPLPFDDDYGQTKPISTAKWRWYTTDLLGLTGPDTSRAERASLHRAIKSLEAAGELESRGSFPYPEAFGVDGLDSTELSRIDPRWPHRSGRSLWFRIPPPWTLYYDVWDYDGLIPAEVPDTDAAYVVDFLHLGRPDWFDDFCGAIDRRRRWLTPHGRLVTWIFCGPP